MQTQSLSVCVIPPPPTPYLCVVLSLCATIYCTFMIAEPQMLQCSMYMKQH